MRGFFFSAAGVVFFSFFVFFFSFFMGVGVVDCQGIHFFYNRHICKFCCAADTMFLNQNNSTSVAPQTN